jgi:phosphoglycerate dehydrogenase-like enzyme
MTVTLAMHQQSLDHIGERLQDLKLDVDIVTFDASGRFVIGGTEVAPEEVDVDYVWLSSHLNQNNALQTAFDVVLACRSVDVVQTFNAGLDNPRYREIADRGIRLCNSSAQGVAISEYVIGQVLSVLQPIERQRAMQAAREWKRTPFREISRTNWLIVGFGPIGSGIAKRVKAFGAGTMVVRRTPAVSEIVDQAGTMDDLAAFLPKADIIVLACPLNDETRGFADAAVFAKAKQGAILVNVARGGLIDDPALIQALDDGTISTAILDVFHREPLPSEDPLWSHPKVRMTPHTSFAGDGVQGRWDRLFLDNIQRYVEGRPLAHEVDPKDI